MKRKCAERSPAKHGDESPGEWPRAGWAWIAAAGLVVATVAWIGWGWFWQPLVHHEPSPASAPQGKVFPISAIADSPYLNTLQGAGYVGTRRCIECHADQHETYLATAHSRSMSAVDPAREPGNGEFVHGASSRKYLSFRQGDRLRHRESLWADDGNEILLCDYPLSYLVGSGRFARTYLVEDQGFLVESPLTWYVSLDKWAMSPGYDAPHHRSFHRTIEHSCLYCHAGNCQPVESNDQRLELVELAIGCERCHGPGSLHVARHAAGNAQAAPEGDRTIVNPSRLPRDLAEAVCHQCHLTSEVQIAVRGRSPADFRPALRWQDFAIDYEFDDPAADMTVVGHVAQMRQSRCYQQSDSLTCITCHAQHEPVAAAQRIAHYRATCQQCHAEPACRVELATRTAQNANDCVACHMPQSSTDVPHVAFTHHRIGIHSPAAASRPSIAAGKPRLRPVLDDSSLPEIDRRRALGLAYFQYYRDHDQDEAARHCLAEARKLIESTLAAGLIDAPLAQARAELAAADGDSAAAARWATTALAGEHLTSKERSSALRLLAGIALQENREAEAQQHLEELTTLRRDPRDWFLLGASRQRQGDAPAAIAAWERVLQIDSAPPETHELLAALYSAQGNELLAKQRRDQAILIRQTIKSQ
jgi:tetratricopeptide (TPR) repeat protein